MVRVLSALSALVVAATVLWLSLRGAELLFPIFQAFADSGRASRASHLSTFFGLTVAVVVAVAFAIKERRAKRDEDVPLTPIVRRLPSGLREL